MNPDAASYLTVNRDIRRILVSHWIDLGRVSVHTARNAVYVRGSLQKLCGTDSELTPALVTMIHRRIKEAAGDRHVNMEFDNWFFNAIAGSWEPASSRVSRAVEMTKEYRQKTGETTYEITE